MEDSVTKQLEKIKDAPGLAINSKMSAMLQVLSDKGLLYEQKLPPCQVMVHPLNRCGLVVNSHDSHCKGFMTLQCGFDVCKLAGAYCIETSKSHDKKILQIQENQKLIDGSEKRLAPLTGTERHLSLSCNHISQFCKSVAAGSSFTQHEQLSSLTLDSLSAHFNDPAFESAVKHGWVWKCVSAEVEESCGWFPAMLQASLNTGNSVASTPTEIEVAMTLAYWYQKQKNMEDAMKMTQISMPLQCLDIVSHYVRSYGGGEDMNLIHLLYAINKMHGSSLFLGTDFFDHITFLDFKERESTFPFVRCACIAAQLHSPKSQDSIARMLVKSDLDRLKQPGSKENLKAAEKLLALSWTTLQAAGWTSQKEGIIVMARNLIRTALYLCKKSGKGREHATYDNL